MRTLVGAFDRSFAVRRIVAATVRPASMIPPTNNQNDLSTIALNDGRPAITVGETKINNSASDILPSDRLDDDDDELEFGDSDHRSDRRGCGHFSEVASRIFLHPCYTIVYIIVFLLQLFLVIWGIVHHQFFSASRRPDAVWYICLDWLVTLLMAAEISIRITVSNRKARGNRCIYFRRWYNVMDFIIIVLCFLALFIYFVDSETAIIASGLQVIRYISQSVRMCLLIKHHRQRRAMAAAADDSVDFSVISTNTHISIGGHSSIDHDHDQLPVPRYLDDIELVHNNIHHSKNPSSSDNHVIRSWGSSIYDYQKLLQPSNDRQKNDTPASIHIDDSDHHTITI